MDNETLVFSSVNLVSNTFNDELYDKLNEAFAILNDVVEIYFYKPLRKLIATVIDIITKLNDEDISYIIENDIYFTSTRVRSMKNRAPPDLVLLYCMYNDKIMSYAVIAAGIFYSELFLKIFSILFNIT